MCLPNSSKKITAKINMMFKKRKHTFFSSLSKIEKNSNLVPTEGLLLLCLVSFKEEWVEKANLVKSGVNDIANNSCGESSKA